MKISDLSLADLRTLRRVVRKVRMRFYPSEKCTDREADRIIESIGEETAQKMLKRAIDSRLVH